MQPVKMRTSLLAGMVCLLFLIIGWGIPKPSWAADNGTDNRQAVLDKFGDFAAKFCGEYSKKGEKTEFILSGKAKADLNALLDMIVDLDLSGEAKSQISKYEGVLQEHLEGELKSIRACKLILWNDLKTIFPPLRDLVSQFESTRTIELSEEIVTYGRPFEIIAKELMARNATIRAMQNGSEAPSKARKGRDGANGPHGAEEGKAGRPGTDGGAGTDGSASENIGAITIRVGVLSGTLFISSSGAAGEHGGDGGRGGNGGKGGSGMRGASNVLKCLRQPGRGGAGGSAGRGGDAGNGGNGANAGDVTIIADEVRSNTKIIVASKGGSGGKPGKAGEPGEPGEGGPRGAAEGYCSTDPNSGPYGRANEPGSTGQPGEKGKDGQIKINVGGHEILRTGSYTYTFEN